MSDWQDDTANWQLDEPDLADWQSDVDEGAPVKVPTKSERVLPTLQNIGPATRNILGALDAAIAAGSVIGGQMVSGYAGLAGGVAGMVPGGETPLEKAGRWQERTAEGLRVGPFTQPGQAQLEVLGKAGAGLEKAGKFTGSGYAGLAALPGGIEEANLAIEDFRGTSDALAEGAYQVTRSPAAAAVARLLPELASLGVIKRPPELPGPRYPQQMDIPREYGGGVTRPATRERFAQPERPQARTSEFEELEAALRDQDVAAARRIINANPAIVAAFDELGIQFAPQMVSESAAFRTTVSGMKSRAGSYLGEIDTGVQESLNRAVGDFVNRYGSTDRHYIDESLRNQYDREITDLEELAEELFAEIDAAMPQGERVDVTAPAEYIEQRISDLGAGDIAEGLKSASKHEKSLWNLTHRRVKSEEGEVEWVDRYPSYAALDAYRKDVGSGLRGRGRFRNGQMGELSHTYRLVAEAQQEAADRFGLGEAYRDANFSVEWRKGLETRAEGLLGRNMERGAIQAIDAAATGLMKGDINRFRQLMENTPEQQRQLVATAVINNLFKPGAQRELRIGEGFLRSYDALDRYPAIKTELFAYLPDAARGHFDAIGRAARGFYRSMEKDNRSNTANARNVNEAIEKGTLWTRLWVGYSRRAPGILGREWMQSIVEEGGARRARAAENFVTSPSLEQAVREYAAGRNRIAARTIEESTEFKIWLASITARERDMISRIGIVPFLFTSQIEEE